ncbi:class IV adenylate cyclase [Aeromonas veronii]|uniref:class IV adenylate cyclase n=1 Tax=Aeromonas veronii TaxID=654 RepID=UPI0035BAFDB9
MSQAHFQGRFEVEFKYQLTDRPAFLKALLALNPEIMLEDNLEQDRYFDTPDDALAQAGKSLAIRTIQPSGIQLWIVKGPEKDRCEAVTINDADKAVSMLLTMNYRQILVITKRRSIYFIGPFHVTLDHLAEIGDFAELASNCSRWQISWDFLPMRRSLAPTEPCTPGTCRQYTQHNQRMQLNDRQTRLAHL